MDEKGRPPRWLGIVLAALVVVVVAAVIAASVMQRPAPAGTAILGKPLPEDHPPGPCYQCHRGMSTGQEIYSQRLPEDHPAERCSECHEGAGEPTIVGPGMPPPAPEETSGPAGSVLDFEPQ